MGVFAAIAQGTCVMTVKTLPGAQVGIDSLCGRLSVCKGLR